jgi:hypothetical protein
VYKNLCKRQKYAFYPTFWLALVDLHQKNTRNSQQWMSTEYKYAQIFIIIIIANADGDELFWRRVQGEKSNKAKSEHGKSLLLIWLGVLRRAESL